MWVEKYRPETLSEVMGNDYAKEEFLRWIGRYRAGNVREKGVFLVGPQGVGKTSFVLAAARELDFHLLELNASDVRTSKALESFLSRLPRQRLMDTFIEGREKSEMVFLDEVEGIHGVADRGGLKTLLEFAEREEMLLVLSANFPDPRKHRKLLSGFKVIPFKPLNVRQLLALIGRVASKEGVEIAREKMERLAVLSRGDARFALNKLQELASGYGDLEETWVETLPLKEAVTDLLGRVSLKQAREIISSSLASPEDIYKALAESIASSDLSPGRKASSLDALSRVDVLMGRIRRRSLWKLYRELILLIPGAVEELHEGEVGFSEGIPQYVFYRWIKRRRRSLLDDLSKRLGRRLHMSSRKTLHHVLPYLSYMIGKGDGEMGRGLGVTRDEKTVLLEVL